MQMRDGCRGAVDARGRDEVAAGMSGAWEQATGDAMANLGDAPRLLDVAVRPQRQRAPQRCDGTG